LKQSGTVRKTFFIAPAPFQVLICGMAVVSQHERIWFDPSPSDRHSNWHRGRSMGVLLTSHGIPHADTSATRQPSDITQGELEKVSATTLAFASIWTGFIAYLALRALLG
jgi:hypothetical protein